MSAITFSEASSSPLTRPSSRPRRPPRLSASGLDIGPPAPKAKPARKVPHGAVLVHMDPSLQEQYSTRQLFTPMDDDTTASDIIEKVPPPRL